MFCNYSFSPNGVKEASDLAKVGQRRTALPTSLLESSNPSDITAFYNYQGSIFLRSSRGEMIYEDLVHEGTHALDYLEGFGMNGSKSIWNWETRAFSQERQFQIMLGRQVEFSSLPEMKLEMQMR
ncbi:hypothetical protein [Clostridium manihotivorum]|uniref:hypothetical protein n=1 Tax=Clostridium manihotivorum TaxID=2320868 RepID=UPI000FE31EEC|nr:hypothetical protein [Clostridium manihotivorum]